MKYLRKITDNFQDLMQYSATFILSFIALVLIVVMALTIYSPALSVSVMIMLMLCRVLCGLFTGK